MSAVPESEPKSQAKSQPESQIERLLEIMARLRDPDGGCPWDLEQSFATIAPYTIEEAYEVAEAVRQGDMAALRDELGDLLLQVVFHARMAAEAGRFDFADVARAICDKMVRRHPHVFADAEIDGAAAQTREWEAHKAAEREVRARAEGRPASALDGVPLALPALSRADKLQRRAARVGFDWPETGPVLDKIDEEGAELRAAVAGGEGPERLAEELGDLLFACANLARHLGLEGEAALRAANAKFERRFRRVEALLGARGAAPEEVALEEMDRLWEQAKAEERE
ncbi:MAG: nucleoside triphosphate pyrophosphohydrolase [Alphaproteobacteria bacterium]|nr:nucleoside triphosphate pyrophosphohydrolase [Alphaproteobacteria bacterium]